MAPVASNMACKLSRRDNHQSALTGNIVPDALQNVHTKLRAIARCLYVQFRHCTRLISSYTIRAGVVS